MTNFIVKEKLISGKCVERVTIPKKVIYQGVLLSGRLQLDLRYKELKNCTSFSNNFCLCQLETKNHYLQTMLAIRICFPFPKYIWRKLYAVMPLVGGQGGF